MGNGDLFVVWRYEDGRWSKVTQPVSREDARRMCNSANAEAGPNVRYQFFSQFEVPR